MDRAIPKKTWTTKRILTIAGITAIVLLIAGSFYFTAGGSKLNVQTDRITVSEVTKGPFQVTIPVNGVVMPISTIYLDAMEGGRVEEKYVEDGTIMKKGEPIMRLSNTDLELNLVNQETSVYNLLTQMQIARNAALQNTTSKLNQMTDVENDLKEAQRVYELNKRLYEQKAIGLQDYKQALNKYNYQVAKKKLTQQLLNQDSASTKQQLAQAQQSFGFAKCTCGNAAEGRRFNCSCTG